MSNHLTFAPRASTISRDRMSRLTGQTRETDSAENAALRQQLIILQQRNVR
jgi:hypothetical protein